MCRWWLASWLTNRNRADLDWKNGVFTWRHRNKLTMERTVTASIARFLFAVLGAVIMRCPLSITKGRDFVSSKSKSVTFWTFWSFISGFK
jgi:hypothetical protein